jgi:CheY-like chemotaxis protein
VKGLGCRVFAPLNRHCHGATRSRAGQPADEGKDRRIGPVLSLSLSRVVRAYRPHLCVLGLGMLGPGCEAVREMARLEPRPLLAALTGHAGEDHRRLALEAVFDRYLVKPVDPAAILALLEEAARG